jgi:hypothetical protein
VGAGTTRGASSARFAAIFGSAVVVGLLGQLVWLAAGSRAMPTDAFGRVLAAQAVYGVAQFLVDSGTVFLGARAAAARTLDPTGRAAIVRLRLTLAALAAPAILALGGAGGGDSLLASAPFAAAILLYAGFDYWSPLGRGDSRPWSAYVGVRSVVPAVAATVFVVLGTQFPLLLAGVLELVVLGAAGALARTYRLADLPRAVGPSGLRWREVMDIGLPSVLWQLMLASGVVLLNVSGAPAAAAVLAVGIRLLTGLNQLAGVAATSLFPRLAGRAADRTAERILYAGAAGTVSVAAATAAAVAAAPALATVPFLARTNSPTDQAVSVVVSIAAASGLVVMVNIAAVAARRERRLLFPNALGAAAALIGGAAVVISAPAREALWMACALAIAHLAVAAALVLHVALERSLVAAIRLPLSVAVALAAGGPILVVAELQPFLAAGATLAALVLAGSAVRHVSRLSRFRSQPRAFGDR